MRGVRGARACGCVCARARARSAPAPRPPQDLLFLGDFNADCNYVRERDWPSVRLRSSEVFKWLIPDSADTTVGNSDCAYDRIVACGARLRRSLKPQSAAVHNFQEEFGLDQAQASARARGGGAPLLNTAPLAARFWLKGSSGMAEDALGLFSRGVSSPGPSPPAGCTVGSIPGRCGGAGVGGCGRWRR